MTSRAEALDRILELSVLVGGDMTRGLAEQGLTEARAHLLWELAARGASTQQSLAAAMRVSPRNITGLVDGLVRTGFVTRERHPTDRRATLVTLTDQGSAATLTLRAGRQKYAEQLFAGWTDDRLGQLDASLGAVVATLRELLDQASAGSLTRAVEHGHEREHAAPSGPAGPAS